jgi:hypothetical protein
MRKTNNKGLSVFLSLFIAVFLVIPFISSCGKGSTSNAAALNIQYQIVNLNSGLGSVDLYVNYIKVNSSSYFYPTASGYFYLSSITTPFQIRPGTSLTPGTVAPSSNLLSLDSVLKPNLKYTLMIMGVNSTDSLYYNFTADTSSTPKLGRGKVRFVNASPRTTTGLSVTANDTTLFSAIAYTKYSDFKELIAGTYDFKIFAPGTTTVLKDIPNVTIQDGRLYTLYSYGVANRTDSLAFGSGFITNK